MAKQKMKTRQVKIHALYRPEVARWSPKYDSGRYVPWPRVNGLWLEKAGFKIGDRIEIVVKNNRLVIRKAPPVIPLKNNQ